MLSPTRSAGTLDRLAQLVAAHRPDQHVVGRQNARQLGVGGAAPVVVRPQREHQDGASVALVRRAHELGDESPALFLASAGREGLLELVDGQQDATVAADAGRRAAELA